MAQILVELLDDKITVSNFYIYSTTITRVVKYRAVSSVNLKLCGKVGLLWGRALSFNNNCNSPLY